MNSHTRPPPFWGQITYCAKKKTDNEINRLKNMCKLSYQLISPSHKLEEDSTPVNCGIRFCVFVNSSSQTPLIIPIWPKWLRRRMVKLTDKISINGFYYSGLVIRVAATSVVQVICLFYKSVKTSCFLNLNGAFSAQTRSRFSRCRHVSIGLRCGNAASSVKVIPDQVLWIP